MVRHLKDFLRGISVKKKRCKIKEKRLFKGIGSFELIPFLTFNSCVNNCVRSDMHCANCVRKNCVIKL